MNDFIKGVIMSIHRKPQSNTPNTEQNAEQNKTRNTIKFTHLTIKQDILV